MEMFMSACIYIMIIFLVIISIRKKKMNNTFKSIDAEGMRETSSMPHEHRKAGSYDTYNKKRRNNSDGAMPHQHEKKHYTSMSDASKLPPGFILLNGEPVRVADLEGK